MATCDLSSLRGFLGGYLFGDLWHDLRTHQEALKQAVSTAAQAAASECCCFGGRDLLPLRTEVQTRVPEEIGKWGKGQWFW